MIKLTQEHLEALLEKFGGEHNPPSIYLEVGGREGAALSPLLSYPSVSPAVSGCIDVRFYYQIQRFNNKVHGKY